MTHIEPNTPIPAAHNAASSRTSPFTGLRPLADRLQALDTEVSRFCDTEERAIAGQARKLRRQIREFEPGVTFIGQVKAGKTTLVNAIVGWADLLPADVNPWTSVVTSLHLSPGVAQDERRSSFRFFSDEEWDGLIRQGGRVGELAARAGAEDEMEKVRQQLDEMREKSKARLGRKFHLLLGQTHDYDSFDAELIERYVCLGDDFWEESEGDWTLDQFSESRKRGRFADITKSADLWFGADTPLGLCIQDTPGVNDTFMIREQITINALRDSRLCVMVLSAAQALSAVDLGLIRLISNVKSREIIIFVNRIDELTDPVRDVPEIRRSIESTLKRFHGPTDAQILFGSGHWAAHAAAGSVDRLGPDSAEALMAWTEAHLDDDLAQKDPMEIIWTMSGVPALGQAIAGRIEQDCGAALEVAATAALDNLRTGLAAKEAQQDADTFEASGCRMAPGEIAEHFAQIERQAYAALEQKLHPVQETLTARTENARRTFLARASASLSDHLEAQGDSRIWTYDPAGLRMLLRTAYQVFVQGAGKAGQEVLDQTAAEIDAVFRNAFDLADNAPAIAPPPLPAALPPVALGQTIALDLRGSWWSRFWRRRRGFQALADDFARLIHEETGPVVDALRHDCADPYVEALRRTVADFTQAQRDIVLGLADSTLTLHRPGKRAG